MHAPARLPFSGSGQVGRSQIVSFCPSLYSSAKSARRNPAIYRHSKIAAAASNANEQGDNGLRARLTSLRRSPSGASSSSDDSHPSPSSRNPLEHLRSSSENLRVLLERRARRQQHSSNEPDSPAEGQSRPTGLVPSGSNAGEVAPTRQGGSDMEPGAGGRRTSRIRFWLKYRAEWGQRLKVVGSHDNLGSWGLDGAPELKWSEGDMWHCMVDLPAGTIVEYKYVLLDHSGQHAIAWQRGNNSVLAVRHSDEFVEVFDNWGGDPGAQVVSDGGPPTTREGRLLSWAGEVDAQLNAQRSELRRARMELVASQEDAKMARQDAQRYRTQLAQQEAEKMVAIARAKELEVANQVLHAKLDDVTRSFRQALETAADLMEEADGAMGDGSGSEGGPGLDVDGAAPQGRMGGRGDSDSAGASSGGEDARLGVELGRSAAGGLSRGGVGGVNGQSRGWGVNGSGAAGDGMALRRRRGAGEGPSPLPGARLASAKKISRTQTPAKLPRSRVQRRPGARRRAPLLPSAKSTAAASVAAVAAAAATPPSMQPQSQQREAQPARTRLHDVLPAGTRCGSSGGGTGVNVVGSSSGSVLMRGALGLARAVPSSPSSTPRSGSPARMRRTVRVAAVPAAKTGTEAEAEGANPPALSQSSSCAEASTSSAAAEGASVGRGR